VHRSTPVYRFLAAVLLSSLVALVLLDAGQAQTSKGKKYALLVGVRDYDHSRFAPLRYTENDMEELAKALPGFEVKVLTTSRGQKKADEAPTATNIRKQLRRLLDKRFRHDMVLVALDGHGLQCKVTAGTTEKEESFFCPADARPRGDATLAEQSKTMLGFTELFRELDDCGAAVKLLLVDACRNDPKEGPNVDVDTLPRLPRGTPALFSCRSGERAFETPKLGKGHGVFFYHVIQGLKSKAKNARGEVTWSRLAVYVVDAVSEDVPKLIGGGARQTPEWRISGKSPSRALIEGTR
jgi:uncharacterized caspase-like protein